MDLGQVGRWERGTHQPRSGGESRRAVTWSDPSFPNPRTVSTVVESLLIILCLYCIYKCIRRPHNNSANMITSKGEPIFAHVNMHGFRWKFMAPSSSRAQNSFMKIAERSSLKILPSPNTTHYHSRQSSRCGCFSPGWNPTQPMHVSFNSDLKYVSQNKLTRR